jgi:hypothetical protein
VHLLPAVCPLLSVRATSEWVYVVLALDIPSFTPFPGSAAPVFGRALGLGAFAFLSSVSSFFSFSLSFLAASSPALTEYSESISSC